MMNLFKLPWLYIAAGLIATASFASGWQTRDHFCDAAAFAARAQALTDKVRHLEANIERMTRVAAEDALRNETNVTKINELEGIINDAAPQIGDGVCLSGSDADRLRSLWK
jgi:hypothetical protein